MTIVFGSHHISIHDIAAIARKHEPVDLSGEAIESLQQAYAVLASVAAGGQRISGLNTGLGANLNTKVEDTTADFQRQLIQGRSASIGDPMPKEQVRATMAARIAGLAKAGSGISPQIVEQLAALLNAGVHPRMPSIGSIGVSDLLLLGPVALMLIGEGEVEYLKENMPAAKVLDHLGLAPARLALKDGLALISASAASAGHGALAIADAIRAYRQQQQAAALTFAAFGANQTILDPRIHAARPGFGQIAAAAELRELLNSENTPAPSTLQDPLSIRCLPVIHGALADLIDRAKAAVEIELNSPADSPLVLTNDGLVLSTPNFHTSALSLAFESLGLGIAQAAAASAARFILLTGAARNGLPKYLSPVGGASAGFVSLQKAVTAILAVIRHKANPAMLDFLPVSEGVEDHATQTPLSIAKCADMIRLWQRLVAFELMAGAQAAYLRTELPLSPVIRTVYQRIGELSAPLTNDRSLGADAEAVYAALVDGDWPA